MPTAKVQTRGRVTLPAEVRRTLEVEPGDQVAFVETTPGRFELQAEARAAALARHQPVSRLSVPASKLKRQMELPI